MESDEKSRDAYEPTTTRTEEPDVTIPFQSSSECVEDPGTETLPSLIEQKEPKGLILREPSEISYGAENTKNDLCMFDILASRRRRGSDKFCWTLTINRAVVSLVE